MTCLSTIIVTRAPILGLYEDIVVTFEFVSELHSLSVPWNKYLKCCTYDWQCSPFIKAVVLCSLKLRCSKNLKTEWKSVASSVAFAASKNFLADTWSAIPTERTYLKRRYIINTCLNVNTRWRTAFQITVRQPKYVPSIKVLRLSPRARFPNVSTCPTLIDAPLDTDFPGKAASRPKASNQRPRDTVTTDEADSKPFDVPML